MLRVAVFLACAAAGWFGAGALRPSGDAPAYVRGVPVKGSASVEGSVADPYGLPPAVPRGSDPSDWPGAPPWSVLVWRDARGRWCHEAGPVVDDSTPGRGDQIPGVHHTESTFLGRQVGSLRPDFKSGVGIQFYDLGRFLEYPTQEGGSCGDPAAGAGLLLSLEHRYARRDLGPDRTVVSGIAGPRVAAVSADGRDLALSHRRAFIALYDRRVWPVVTVRYRDGSTRRFAFR